jgi:hypothetical protein
VPPVAVIGFEYAVLTVPEGNVALIVSVVGDDTATAIDRLTDLAVCAGVEESVTVNVKLAVPLVVGFPEITPAAKLRPVGREPEARDQVYGLEPPVALSVAP